MVHFPRRVRFTLFARAIGVKLAEHALFAWNRRQTDAYDFSPHRKSVNLFLNHPEKMNQNRELVKGYTEDLREVFAQVTIIDQLSTPELQQKIQDLRRNIVRCNRGLDFLRTDGISGIDRQILVCESYLRFRSHGGYEMKVEDAEELIGELVTLFNPVDIEAEVANAKREYATLSDAQDKTVPMAYLSYVTVDTRKVRRMICQLYKQVEELVALSIISVDEQYVIGGIYMQCPNCGNEVLAGEMFCENCGHALSNMGDSPPPPVTPQPEVVEGVPVPPPPPVTPDPAQLVAPVQPSQAPVVPVPPPAVIEQAQPVVAPQVQDVSVQVQPRLALKDGSAEFELKMGAETLVGRLEPGLITPDIDLTPHDPDTGVSRRHASVHEQGGQWFIKDLESTNYTLVNRTRLTPHQDFLIEDGDEVRFGRVITTFRTT